jgi:hypothetical protein
MRGPASGGAREHSWPSAAQLSSHGIRENSAQVLPPGKPCETLLQKSGDAFREIFGRTGTLRIVRHPDIVTSDKRRAAAA